MKIVESRTAFQSYGILKDTSASTLHWSSLKDQALFEETEPRPRAHQRWEIHIQERDMKLLVLHTYHFTCSRHSRTTWTNVQFRKRSSREMESGDEPSLALGWFGWTRQATWMTPDRHRRRHFLYATRRCLGLGEEIAATFWHQNT